MKAQLSTFHIGRSLGVLLMFGGIAFGAASPSASAQSETSPLIKVESREVVLPIRVIQEKKSTGAVEGPNGEAQLGWVLHSKEVTGLSAKSVHVFEDGVEAKIQHFSVEQADGWAVHDNVGSHLDYSCTPRGIWVAPDVANKATTLDSKFHTYLVTYVPLPSPTGSCHRISIKVDRRHSKVFAPGQYCNTKDPLSDPLKDTELGDRLIGNVNSNQVGELPLSVKTSSFAGLSGAARVNLSAEIPANLLERHWDGVHLVTSIAVLGLVFDSNGKLVSRFSDTACAPAEEGYSGPLPLPAFAQKEFGQVMVPSGYRTQVDLGPGDYRLELLLTDGEKFGRASTSFTVDDFSRAALSLSGIALCKRYHKPAPDERGPTRAPQYLPLMFDGQEFTPTGDTRFKKGEQLLPYLEIYGTELRAADAPKLFLEMKVFDERTGELKIGTGARPVDSPMRPDYPAIPVVWEMEVADRLPNS